MWDIRKRRTTSIGQSPSDTIRRMLTLVSLRVLQYLGLTLGAVLMVFPFFWTLSTAIKPDHEIFTVELSLLPKTVRLVNFVRAWTAAPFSRFLLNTTVISCVGTGATILVDSLAAFAFAKYRFAGRNVIFVVVLATLMIPGQVTLIPVFLIVRELGWINTYMGVIVPGVAHAFGVFLLRQYMLTLPDDLIHAGRIDGCSDLMIFVRIIVPLALPAISVLAILTFIRRWNEFLWPLIVLNSEKMFTVQIGLQRFIGEYYVTYNYLMAAATISTLPMVIVFFMFQGSIVQGITRTGLKD